MQLKYGMVGFGLNAIGHVAELTLHPKLRGHLKWIAGFDPNPKATERLKGRKNVKTANSFEDLLDTPEMNGLIVSSPPQFHADQVVAALEAGLHVYSEVPMAINAADVERIVNAADQSKGTYILGENYCYMSEVLFAGHLIESGKIGPSVYAESEYLHDVSYRWREGGVGDETTNRVDSWYQLFDPLMYAHSIGPAQVALGGIKNPKPFLEVTSLTNNNGGYNGQPVCSPANSFHVALFRTEDESIAKCANAYVFAREPTRLTIQVTGRTGTYECYHIGKKGRLFQAEGHMINKMRHRKGKVSKIGKLALRKVAPLRLGSHHGSGIRIVEDWIDAIEKGRTPNLNARVAGNQCLAGIAASESAKNHKNIPIKTFD